MQKFENVFAISTSHLQIKQIKKMYRRRRMEKKRQKEIDLSYVRIEIMQFILHLNRSRCYIHALFENY